MEFTLKRAATDYDIPLAYISMGEVKASDVVQIHDHSSELDNNPSAAFRSIQTYPSTQYYLNSDNVFGRILVTDEYYYDQITGSKVAMWYSHPLRQAHYNPNVVDRSVKQRVREDKVLSDRTLKSLVPSQGSYVIVTGSVEIQRKLTAGSSYTTLTRHEYYVDYSVGTVIVSENAMYDNGNPDTGTPIYEYKVNYKLAPISMRVQTKDVTSYRIELFQIDQNSDEYFTVNVLTDNDEQLLVKYRTRLDTGVIGEAEEYTTAIPMFTEVDEDVREDIATDSNYDVLARRVFSRVSSRVYTTEINGDHTFNYKPRYAKSTKISVESPYPGDFTSDWRLTITEGSVTNNNGTYTIEPQTSKKRVREQARVVDKETIAVSGRNLAARLNYDGTWNGIIVTKRKDGSTIGVNSIDAKHGVITLSSHVSRKDEIDVDYMIYSSGLELYTPSFNPMLHYSGRNGSTKDMAAIVCIVEAARVPPERRYPIYIKYVNMLSGGRPVTFSYDTIDGWINSTSRIVRTIYRSDMGLPSEFLGNTLIRVEPLAVVQLVNPLDSDAYDTGDMRVFGGGYSSTHRSFYDYSIYDGESADLESMLVIEVPGWIKNDLAERAKLWDVDVTKSSASEIDKHAEARALSLIEKAAKKFSMLGTTQEVVIGTKTITDNS